jgi:hypothetical protein
MLDKSVLSDIRPGLIITGLVLCFGILMGVAFGIFEDAIKEMVSVAVDSNAAVHAEDLSKAKAKIFRWWQRSHFHATGVSAFTFALLAIVALSDLKPGLKRLSSLLIAIGGLYPLSWLIMAIKAPAMGRPAAHHYIPVQILVFITVICLLVGIAILFSNICFRSFSSTQGR